MAAAPSMPSSGPSPIGWRGQLGTFLGCCQGAGAVREWEAEEVMKAVDSVIVLGSKMDGPALQEVGVADLPRDGAVAGAATPPPATPALAPARLAGAASPAGAPPHEAGRRRSKGDSEPEGSVSTAVGTDVEGASVGSGSCASCPPAPSSWWRRADVGAIRGFEGVEEVSRLLEARVVLRRGAAAGRAAALDPPSQSEELHRAMGVRDPAKAYVVCWLHFGDVSLVFASEATDSARLEASIAGDALLKRIKFILNPVRIGVPCPAKGLKDADTVGAFFGPKGSSLSRLRTADGAECAVLQIDMHSKMLLRMMLSKVAFREGNCVEMLLADWTGKAVLSSVRLEVTQELLQLLR